ncbi:hypothetical protein Ancab_003988 [Ancistrocladus abbreviatus]
MKGLLDRTKVVLRHLPPSISQATLLSEIDPKFSSRYNWVSFHPGKSSPKHVSYSRAYINFNNPEDVIEFAEFFDGHVFVNEKGTQFKAIVEYAPSQRIPKQLTKKDGREGTLFKDPEYLEFLEFLAKPVENLPSAEIQLERKEAEQAGAGKDTLIVTPLMDFVRKKRAAKSGSRRSLTNGKPMRRTGGGPVNSPGSVSSKRGIERRVSTTMYVMKDNTRRASRKDKSAYVLVPKREDQQLCDKSLASGDLARNEVCKDENGTADTEKKKIMLLKGKERETSRLPGHLAEVRISTALTPSQRREGSGRTIRNILQSEQQVQSLKLEKDRKTPHSSNVRLLTKDVNGALDDKVSGNDFNGSDRLERRVRNKDRPDRGVWTALRKSDGSQASDEPLSPASQTMQSPSDSLEGAHRYFSRRAHAHNMKDADGGRNEKHSRRGGPSYSGHEKQVWVQKSSAGP